MPQKKVSPPKSPGTERKADEPGKQEPQQESAVASEDVTPSNGSKTKNTSKKPNSKKKNLILLLVSTMFFKLSFESVGTCFSNIMLKGLPADTATQAWAILLIIFGLAQSISATLVGRFMIHHSANRIVAIAVWFFAALILVVIILDASTGGTVSQGGNWTPWLLYPIYIGVGFCLGVVEVGRKTLPPLILGTDPDKLEQQVAAGDDEEGGAKEKNTEIHGLVKLNAAVHICYEIAGTAGAFLSTPVTRGLGFRYALFHLPITFPIAGILFWFIKYEMPQQQDHAADQKTQKKKNEGLCSRVVHQIKRYFQQIWLGARIVLTHRSFNWLVLAFIVPQMLHRIFENLVIPIYFSYIVNDGTLQGLGIGGSNFGELCGAAVVFLAAKLITNPLIWVASDALAMNLMWVMPFLFLGHTQLGWAFTIAALMWLISGTWAAGDISTMAYIQHALPERAKLNEDDEDDVSPLGAVLGFLYATYAVCIAIVLYLLGQFLRVPNNDPTLLRDRFIYVICIPVSIIAVLILINAVFARIVKTDHPDGREHWRPTMCSCRRGKQNKKSNRNKIAENVVEEHPVSPTTEESVANDEAQVIEMTTQEETNEKKKKKRKRNKSHNGTDAAVDEEATAMPADDS